MPKDVRLLGWPFAGASAQCSHQQTGGLWLRNVTASAFFMDLAPSGPNLLPNMRKRSDIYVFADNKEMMEV